MQEPEPNPYMLLTSRSGVSGYYQSMTTFDKTIANRVRIALSLFAEKKALVGGQTR